MRAESRSWRNFAVMIAVLAVIFAVASGQYLRRFSMPARSGLGIYSCFLLLLVLSITPAIPAPRSFVASIAKRRWRQFLFVPAWCLPYAFYAAGTGDFDWQVFTRLLAIALSVPLIYWAIPVPHVERFHWQDLLVGTWLFSLALLHGLRGIWAIPVNLDFMGRLFLLAVGSWTWTFIRRVPGLGYRFEFSSHVVSAAALNFALFAVIAIPASLAMRFTEWNPKWRGPAQFALTFLEIWLFVALLEELFFRGFLQSLLSNSLRAPWRGQLLTSCLFGLSHLLHAPVPNWRYVALASVAGWFYGSAFRNGRGVLASSLAHAMVDTAWRTWFARV